MSVLSLCDICEQANFIMGGGVLGLLTQVLSEHVDKALILQPAGEDLSVVDVVGIPLYRTTIEKGCFHVKRRISSNVGDDWRVLLLDDDFRSIFLENWTHMVILGGDDCPVMVLLGEEPSESLGRLFSGAHGLVRIWSRYRSIDEMERSMASLSYLLYAVKSALPSIFEPFPPEFLATFLVDVMRESFCPKTLSLFKDDGRSLVFVAGDPLPVPIREGIFSDKHLSPVPIILDERHSDALGVSNGKILEKRCSVVLPIISGSDRFFYLIEWGGIQSREAGDVLELIGGVTAKAMAMSRMREESASQVMELSRREFALRGLHEATLSLMENDTEDGLVGRMLDIFGEMTQSRVTWAVIYIPGAEGYVLWGERRDGCVCFKNTFLCSSVHPLVADGFPDSLDASSAGGLFQAAGLGEVWPGGVLDLAERVFTLKDGSSILGYVAVSCSVTGGNYGDNDSLETLAASSSVALRRCRLLEEVRSQRNELDRQVRARAFLQELAGDLQQIRSIESLRDGLRQSLPLALGLREARLHVLSETSGAIPLGIARSESPAISGDSVWVPLRSGRQTHGYLELIPDRLSTVGKDRLELMGLVGAFVAPRLDTMRYCPVADSVDLGDVLDRIVRNGIEELTRDGFDHSVIVGPTELSEEQRSVGFKVVSALGRSLVILPFKWDGEFRQLFPSEEGWVLFNSGD